MRAANALAMLERLSDACRGEPKSGYNRRVIVIETCDACDAGSVSIISYELTRRDILSIIRMLKGRDQ